MVSPGAVGCGLRDSGQILQLKVERSFLLKRLRVVLLDGEDVEGEPAGERKGELVERRQAGRQHWRHDGAANSNNASLSVSLDAESHATSSVWSGVAFACGACHACDAWPQRRLRDDLG